MPPLVLAPFVTVRPWRGWKPSGATFSYRRRDYYEHKPDDQ
jgi:hypothetical protein